MWDNLPDDIREELEDPEYSSRQHYSRATYALGCHGPLCRKAERDRGRNRNEQRAHARGNKYKPNHDFRLSDPDNIDEIIEWHVAELAERRTLARTAS